MNHRVPALCLIALVLIQGGMALAAPPQASELRALHREGQTILTWKEAYPLTTAENLTAPALRKLLDGADQERKIRYRIYRSDKPIESVEGMTPIGEARPLSGWNADYWGGTARENSPAMRYVVEEGRPPVSPQTGIYAHNPKSAGEAHYAVTVVVDGVENKTVAGDNRTAQAVKETTGPGPFILQRIEKPKSFNYVASPTLHYFVRWESPPNCSVAGRPFDYLVGVPPKLVKPAAVGIHLHCWGANLDGGYGWWSDADLGAILISTNQIPYDWWTGYHEFKWTSRPLARREDWQGGVVRPFTQNRLWAFFDFVRTKWQVDPRRTFTVGSSMGGSGCIMLALRHGDRIAYARSWVGVHNPARSPQFKSSYESVWGRVADGVKFEDGTPVWDYYNDAWYLRNHPEKEVGFISFSNGKNDGAIGWPQAVEFLQALQETRRPHLFIWGQAGHGTRTVLPGNLDERNMPIETRTDLSLPAFTHCSLDDDPGGGDPKQGDPVGQVNKFLFWKTADIVDEPGRWEMTVGLIDKAPRDQCTVDLTPRRVQKFKIPAGQKVKWINTTVAGDRELGSGEAAADRWGLVTLEKLAVMKGGNRVRLIKE